MTEPRHYVTKMPKSTTTVCVLATILAAVAMFSTRFLGPLIVSTGFDVMMTVVVFRSVLAVAFIIALGGRSWLRFSPRTVRSAWKYSWFMILINVLLSGLITYELVMQIMEGTFDTASAVYWIGYSTILCFFVGINEEGIFRGLFMGGLLAKLGSKKNGPLIAALVSSLAFGAVHVIFDMDFSNIYAIGTGALKTLETSMFALILCVPVMRDKSLWGAMTVHSFFDWVILCGETVANGGITPPTYVSTSPEQAMATMVVFGIIAALYLPKTIRAIKDLRAMELPQNGPFISE